MWIKWLKQNQPLRLFFWTEPIMASFKELSKADVLKVKEIDKGLKNKFRFDWLDHSIIVKTKTCGWCDSQTAWFDC